MTIYTSDSQRYVDIGTSDVWHSLYSTIRINLCAQGSMISQALRFLETASCQNSCALETARQFNLIRDMLSQFSPDCICYDWKKPDQIAPWQHNISPIITSCANFYTTADGGDLLYEIVSILCYAGIVGVSVATQ